MYVGWVRRMYFNPGIEGVRRMYSPYRYKTLSREIRPSQILRSSDHPPCAMPRAVRRGCHGPGALLVGHAGRGDGTRVASRPLKARHLIGSQVHMSGIVVLCQYFNRN
jgi:hypothetical protein